MNIVVKMWSGLLIFMPFLFLALAFLLFWGPILCDNW